MLKELLFIGKVDSVGSEVLFTLKSKFHVQFATASIEGLVDSLYVTKPAIIVVSVTDQAESYFKLFNYIKYYYGSIPVLVIGSNYATSQYKTFFQTGQFHCLLTPTTAPAILTKCIDIIEYIYEPSDTMEHKKYILVVDDNSMLLRNVKKLLEDNYIVSVANSAAEAFVAIDRKKPDLILLDYEMPIINGELVLKVLQADDEYKSIPVVFLTGNSDKEQVKDLLMLKPAGYVLKPPKQEMLLEKIQQLI